MTRDLALWRRVTDCVAGMEVLNRAIESIMNSTDRADWEPTVIHVTDNVLSLWKGEVSASRGHR